MIEGQVTLTMDARQAAAVRQILFEHQKEYTYEEQSVPPRITDIRSVILQLDDNIGKEYTNQSECPPGTVFINGECADI